jgi:hypothetical protein
VEGADDEPGFQEVELLLREDADPADQVSSLVRLLTAEDDLGANGLVLAVAEPGG